MAGPRISRRRFLVASAAVGAAVLATPGLAMLAEEQTPVVFPQFTGGDTTMLDRILVTYASRAGSTAGVAEAIGKTLSEGGALVDVRLMTEVDDLTPYGAVVAGSAIQGNKWLPEAMDFVKAHRSELSRKPFAAFQVCITLAMAGGKYRDGVVSWMEPVRSLVRPVSEGHFAGALDTSKLPKNLDSLGMRLAAAVGIFPRGDHRDWEAIRAWAAELKPILRA